MVTAVLSKPTNNEIGGSGGCNRPPMAALASKASSVGAALFVWGGVDQPKQIKVMLVWVLLPTPPKE